MRKDPIGELCWIWPISSEVAAMGYRHKSENERVLDEFPGLSAEDLDCVEDLYEPFLFYEKTSYGREVWATCCHSHEHVHTMTELFTAADYELLRKIGRAHV